MSIHFILGGARSGKSRLAQQMASDSGLEVTYLATATAGDNEMSERIKHHQNSRPEHWTSIEEPIAIADVIKRLNTPNACILLDCLTLWMTNLLLLDNAELKDTHIKLFLLALKNNKATIIIVSNEVGHGIVPLGKLNRDFVDESGFLHQQVARIADSVSFIMAGLAIKLKE